MSIRSVGADSNVLLSAIAGRAAKRVFASTELVVMTTEHNIAEVREYVPEFAARYSLSEELLHDALTLLPIDVYGENTYIRERPAAQRNLEMERERSQRDIVLVARRDSSRPRH